jgi:predicted small metal-binding protein
MKTLACKDMGGSDDFVAKGATEEEIMDKMAVHVKEMHPEMMEGKSNEEMMEMKKMMKMKIKDEM